MKLERDVSEDDMAEDAILLQCIVEYSVNVNELDDADADTKIQLEESADEDKIRFDTGGTERAVIDSNGLKLESGADVNEFSTDGTLAGNSDDAIPTEKAVKTYVDNRLPCGTIAMYGASSASSGWLLCDGSSLLRTGTYADLFAVIGTTFGSADGTHFNVPNMKGNFPVGVSNTDADYDLGDTGGEKTHTLSVAETPSHDHGTNTGNPSANHNHQYDYANRSALSKTGTATAFYQHSGWSGAGTTGQSNDHTHAITAQGGSGAHENRPPFLSLNFIIKY